MDLAQGTTAPFLIVRSWLGTTRSSSKISFSPSPSQAGHAPCGALNENKRGSISAMVKPDTGQAKRSENTIRPAGAWSPSTTDEGVCGSTGSVGST